MQSIENKMPTKPFGTVYAVLKTPEHVANKEKIKAAEYFRFRLHGANVRVRELGDQYTARSIQVKYTQEHLKSIEAIVPESEAGIYVKIPFYDNHKNAINEWEKASKKFPDATVLEIEVVTNMTKREMRS